MPIFYHREICQLPSSMSAIQKNAHNLATILIELNVHHRQLFAVRMAALKARYKANIGSWQLLLVLVPSAKATTPEKGHSDYHQRKSDPMHCHQDSPPFASLL